MTLKLPQIENRHDVGMLESPNGLRLAVESLEDFGIGNQFRIDSLQRDEARNQRVSGLVNSSHPPLAQLADDFVLTDFLHDVLTHRLMPRPS